MRGVFSRVRVGSQISRRDMLLLALMSSENRAAASLAQNYPGGKNAFVKAMNAKAHALGMKNTRYVEPTGLSLHNVSTARDVERLGYTSQALANQRQLTLYTPPGYDPEGQRYPLLVLFDEDHYARDVPTPTILDNLIAAGRIRPTLAVIVGNVDASSRGRELPCNEAFADMLAHELLPWLQQRYALSEEPADRVLSGSSYGGLASGCIAYRYPERFGKVLSLSGSFWWGPDEQQPQWLVRQFAAGERLPLVFFLSSGLLEEPEADGILGSNRSLRAALQGKGYPLHYREFPGGHDYAAWSLELAEGLQALLPAH